MPAVSTGSALSNVLVAIPCCWLTRGEATKGTLKHGAMEHTQRETKTTTTFQLTKIIVLAIGGPLSTPTTPSLWKCIIDEKITVGALQLFMMVSVLLTFSCR